MVMDSLGAGGTETHVFSISEQLIAQGASLFYGGADGPFYDTYQKAGFQLHLFPTATLSVQQRKQERILFYKRMMKEQGITIVHVHQTPSGIAAATAAKSLRIPVVFTMHGTYYPREEAKELARLSDRIISVSKPVRQFWLKEKIESTVISNGINIEEYAPLIAKTQTESKQLASFPPDSLVITYVSRLAWEKATVCRMVMQSAKSLVTLYPQLQVMVVGSGVQYQQIDSLAKSINQSVGKSFIHVVGEQTDVRPFYAASHIVIGTGRVALEAMACGKPVIAVGNHGFFGLVTPDRYELAWDYYFGDHYSTHKPTAALITEAVKQALKDPEQLKRAGKQAREWIKQEFDIRNKCKQLIAMYESVVVK